MAQAEDIKASKGLCPEFTDVLQVASSIAMDEHDWETAAHINEELLKAFLVIYPQEDGLLKSTKDMIALLYVEAGEHEKAIPLLIESYKSSRGQNFDTDSGFLESIITSYVALKNWKEAISYRKQKNELILKNLGRGLQYANGLYLLSSLHLEVQDEKSAVKILSEAMKVMDSSEEKQELLYNEIKYRYEVLTTGSSSVQSASVVRQHTSDLVQKFDETNDPSPLFDAMVYLGDKEFLPEIDTLRYSIISIIGHYLYDKGDFNKVIEVTTKKAYWMSGDWFLVGNCEENLGHFADACEAYKMAFAKAYQERNDISDNFFLYFDSYARNCIQTGQYQEAFSLLEQFYAEDIAIPGYELRAALYMSILASLKYSINDYRGTIECINKSAPILLHAGSIGDYIQLNLLSCHESLGEYKACITDMESIVSACKSSSEFSDYVPGMEVTLASYLAMVGDKNLASRNVSMIVDRYKTYEFTDFYLEDNYHSALGNFFRLTKDNESAEIEFKKGIDILQKNAPVGDNNYHEQLVSLAYLYSTWHGREAEALPIYEEAFRHVKTYHDENYGLYFTYNMGLLATKYFINAPISASEISDFINVERAQAQHLLFQMSEKEREAFWVNHNHAKELIFSLSNYIASPRTLYDYALLYKGVLLSSSTQIGQIVTSANNEELNALYGKYIMMNQTKDEAEFTPEQRSMLEHQLLAKCQELGYSINSTITTSDVESSLDDDSIAIEFVDYTQMDTASDTTKTKKYVALILKKGWGEPKVIDLGNEELLKDIILSRDKAYSSQSLYDLIWKPLEKYVPIGSKVNYSPAGLLHQVALEAIPAGKGKILSELYAFTRLSSTRELCNRGIAGKPYSSSVVYGGLQYSLSDEELLSNSQLYSYRSTSMSEDYLSRGGDTSSPWRFLPGTRAEAEAVSSLLESCNVSNTLFTGALGNEESFKALSGQSPSILHIATHGFFLQNKDFASSDTNNLDIRGQLQAQKSALKRSGLIMSGANPAWTEGRLLPNVEDGILTAEEISQLDFRNTSLTIISACDSGLGEINNDGVEGLQRAFKSAGVQTLVVTLWQVDDTATELMMSEFYKNLTNGKALRAAFDSARAAVRSKYPEPYYWAPFVMID